MPRSDTLSRLLGTILILGTLILTTVSVFFAGTLPVGLARLMLWGGVLLLTGQELAKKANVTIGPSFSISVSSSGDGKTLSLSTDGDSSDTESESGSESEDSTDTGTTTATATATDSGSSTGSDADADGDTASPR